MDQTNQLGDVHNIVAHFTSLTPTAQAVIQSLGGMTVAPVAFNLSTEPAQLLPTSTRLFVATELVLVTKDDLSSVTAGQHLSIACGLIQQDFDWDSISFELDAENKVVRIVLDGINHLAVSGSPINVFNSATDIGIAVEVVLIGFYI